MDHIYIGFLIGLLSFGHCLGMCGAFALHLSRGRNSLGVMGRQLLWHAGKTTTYVFLGALAGMIGGMAGALGSRPWVMQAIAFATGGIMALVGLGMLGLRLPGRAARQKGPQNVGESGVCGGADGLGGASEGGGTAGRTPQPSDSKPLSPKALGGLFASLIRPLMKEPSGTAALVLGVATGFLPCGIVYATLAVAASSGSVLVGMMTMAAMGLGTVWSLLILGMSGGFLAARLRGRATLLAGAVLVLLGVVTVLRGTTMLRHILPPSHKPAAAQTTTSPCCH